MAIATFAAAGCASDGYSGAYGYPGEAYYDSRYCDHYDGPCYDRGPYYGRRGYHPYFDDFDDHHDFDDDDDDDDDDDRRPRAILPRDSDEDDDDDRDFVRLPSLDGDDAEEEFLEHHVKRLERRQERGDGCPPRGCPD